jgi:tripartite-type tricarboxylate transporter receptor subunit TctC
MNLPRRQFLHLAASAAVLPAAAGLAQAQSYRSRPVTIIVPYAAGGPMDVMTRILAEGLRGALGQTIVIENVAGAGGSIGVTRAVRAAPDGYPLSVGNWSTHVADGAIYPLPFDLLKDLDPVSLLPLEANVIIARKVRKMAAHHQGNRDQGGVSDRQAEGPWRVRL